MLWESFLHCGEWLCCGIRVERGLRQNGTEADCHRNGFCTGVSHSLWFWSFLVKSLEWCMQAVMNKTCCVMCCHSATRALTKACFSFILLLTPRSPRGGSEQFHEKKPCSFTFVPKNVPVCEECFHGSDIVRVDECTVSGVLCQCDTRNRSWELAPFHGFSMSSRYMFIEDQTMTLSTDAKTAGKTMLWF